MKKNKKIYLRILFSILLIATFGIIFIFSSQNGEESTKLSQGFIYNIVKFLVNDNSKIDSIVEIIDPLIRKLAHFSIYTIAGFWCIGLLETFKITDERKIAISGLIGFLYACSDELHQSFISERAASPLDVTIDTLGFLFGIVLIKIIITIYNLKKSRNN